MLRFNMTASLFAIALLLTPLHVRAEAPKPSKVKELLRERLTLLREIAAQSTTAYQTGNASFENVHHANQAVLQAELDLCESKSEKLPLLEKAVAMARQLEATTSKLVQAGEAPTSVAIKAKVGRLEAEIALERLKEE